MGRDLLAVLERTISLPCLDELKAVSAVLRYKKGLYHLASLEFAAAAGCLRFFSPFFSSS